MTNVAKFKHAPRVSIEFYLPDERFGCTRAPRDNVDYTKLRSAAARSTRSNSSFGDPEAEWTFRVNDSSLRSVIFERGRTRTRREFERRTVYVMCNDNRRGSRTDLRHICRATERRDFNCCSRYVHAPVPLFVARTVAIFLRNYNSYVHYASCGRMRR